jgi:predicted transcriptional regulator
VAWPKLAGFHVGPNVPGDLKAQPDTAVSASAAAAPAAAPAAPALAGSAASGETPAPAALKQTVVVGPGKIIKCSDKKNKKISDCGELQLDPVSVPKLESLAECASAVGVSGKLAVGLELDFEKKEVHVVRIRKDKPTDLNKMFNDYWMIDQGFIERERRGDLRDLISRRHEEHGTVTVSADDNLLIAYGRMKLYDISQLPVLDKNGKVVGLIDESDILLKVFHDDSRFKEPISSAMTSKLDTIAADQPMEALLPIFEKDHVAIVFDGDTFLGLITRIDLLNHLRRRMR